VLKQLALDKEGAGGVVSEAQAPQDKQAPADKTHNKHSSQATLANNSPSDLPVLLKHGTHKSADTSATSSKEELVEKGHIWEGYMDDDMPEKIHGHGLRNLRFQIMSMYRRLFGVIFIANMAVFISFCVRGKDNINAKHLGLAVESNLFCAILMRQDYVINGFFNVFTSVPRSWPMWIRRIAARVYAIGGLHSGSGVSGLVWLILFTVQATREVVGSGKVLLPHRSPDAY
jgi:hypothetical protein